MQKWYPESFSDEGSIKSDIAPKVETETFVASQDETDDGPTLEALFRSETGFLDADQLMNNLTRDERAQVFDLVEQDVREEFDMKNKELADEYHQKLSVAQGSYDQSLSTWATEFNNVTELELKKSSAAAARLAILLAEKIVRCQVGIDPDVLARTLETSLFKIQSTAGVKVTVNPDDANTILENEELMKKLNISSVDSDRRIQSGGCLVKSSDMEWDATLESQLGTMAELVEEMISTSESITMPAMKPKDGGSVHEVE